MKASEGDWTHFLTFPPSCTLSYYEEFTTITETADTVLPSGCTVYTMATPAIRILHSAAAPAAISRSNTTRSLPRPPTSSTFSSQSVPAPVRFGDHHPRYHRFVPRRTPLPRILLHNRLRRDAQHGQISFRCREAHSRLGGGSRAADQGSVQRRFERFPPLEFHPSTEGGQGLAWRDGIGFLHGYKPLRRGYHRDRDL